MFSFWGSIYEDDKHGDYKGDGYANDSAKTSNSIFDNNLHDFSGGA